MPVPDFSPGEVWTAAAADAIGLWLVKTQTVKNAVSSEPVTNVFSSTYDNYKIVISGVDCSTFGAQCSIRFNNTSTNNYRWAANWRSVTNVFGGDGQNGVANIWVSLSGDGGDTNVVIDVMNPNKATRTTCTSQFGGADYAGSAGGVDMTNAQHTGFIFIAPAGQTFTGGTIRVYGYRN